MTRGLDGPVPLPDSLRASARWSEARVARLREFLRAKGNELGALVCVAAAGSLGRWEAGPASDVDCLVVGADDTSPQARELAMATVLESIAHAGLRAPRADGFFRQVVRRGDLLDPRRLGRLDESPQVYGKRLQCLLDTQALAGAEHLRALRGRILRWFSIGQPRTTPLALLASELVRYRRSYVAYQHYCLTHGDGDSWRLRIVKLHSSRLVTVAGLLALIGEGSREADPLGFVEAHLELAPLDRLLRVMHLWDPSGAQALASAYAHAHAAVHDPQARARLVDAPAVDLGSLSQARAVLLGTDLDAALSQIGTQVDEFFHAQRGRWAQAFHSGLLL